jgi:creatinine amidohydrolase/Fe(II)-dependent formamide hydrolase-like protein/7-cyano-7-deazaguanine synthase in queuosine biosynthesis
MTPINKSSLVFFKRLRVCNIEVESARVKARYELSPKSGGVIWNDLMYSYSEKLFDQSPSSLNLASMMLSQVAINYGLFCEEIIFDGLFDDTDKRFILDMMENTSREIYVNKFLMKNDFLVPPYDQIPAEKQKPYTAARVSFQNTGFHAKNLQWEHSDTLSNGYLVMSSGGKDSLLSYGLLKELGKEVHPVFINESGRHWYTASNAFKYLRENEPHTAKVWCNSDRVFNWMLRQMPCIRKDYKSLRADMYPIRLWTVAVFLFGVLPLAQKRNLRNVVIGNEYDSTMKSAFKGITHYDSLYDQSKYFDNALTRYYTKKGWSLFQFSLLRSLSELLILKILVKRYPQLQAHQISCHAAHMQDGHAYPCGKCEKCRRIIGMLSAMDESPERCGYTKEQIAFALEKLSSKGVKQLGTDAAHLFKLLLDKKLIPRDSVNAQLAADHPYIMKLRFDNERSTLNDVPQNLYGPLIKIYLGYADGAVHRQNKQWSDFNALSGLLQSSAYPFELSPGENAGVNTHLEYHWAAHTWTEMEEKLKVADTAILPCGSIEQHGPHLPLDVDYFDSVYLANKVAEACSTPKPWVLPPIPYGVAYHHEDFKGTISISNHTLSALVYDVGKSLAKNGIKKLIILNGHGDNAPTLLYAAQMINKDTGIFVCVESGETSDVDLYDLVDTPNDIHAGEIETSTTLAIRPEMVKMDKANNETLNFGSSYLDFTSDRGVAWYVRTKILSDSGIMGNPTLATAEKGNKLWEVMIAHLVRFVEEVKKSKLEDLYQRKY